MTAVLDVADMLYDGIPDHAGLPEAAATDRYWQAALLMLGGFGPTADRVWHHVDRHGIAFAAMVEEPWSSGELLVIRVARALFTGDEYVGSLTELAFRLDSRFWDRLTAALGVLRNGL